MKNIYNALKCASGLQEHHLNKLVVRPLGRRIKQQRRDCLEQGKRIFNKLHEISQSIEIIAREIARQAKQGE